MVQAKRDVLAGEELTYDYMFDTEGLFRCFFLVCCVSLKGVFVCVCVCVYVQILHLVIAAPLTAPDE